MTELEKWSLWYNENNRFNPTSDFITALEEQKNQPICLCPKNESFCLMKMECFF